MSQPPGEDLAQTLDALDEVLEVLAEQGVDGVVIGAMALAVHHYPRETEDLDLAVATEPRLLREIAATLETRGWEVAFREPDPQDPLGGVLDARAPGSELIQVINFFNPPASGFPRLVAEAIEKAVPLVSGRSPKVVDLQTLIAFKLYAGGPKSRLDILELIDRNPSLDIAALRERCVALRLSDELGRVLALAELDI